VRKNAEALSDFTTVISKVPENKPKVADAYFFRGHLHSQADKWPEAELDLEKCLQLKPTHETARQLLRSTQEKLSTSARRAEEAEKELLAQLEQDEEREKKKREKNKQKKQRQRERKKQDVKVKREAEPESGMKLDPDGQKALPQQGLEMAAKRHEISKADSSHSSLQRQPHQQLSQCAVNTNRDIMLDVGSVAECDDDDDDENDTDRSRADLQSVQEPTRQATARKFVPGDDFECPLTLEIMKDPVTDALGYTYERHAIESWLQDHNTSPATNEELPHQMLVTNSILFQKIQNMPQTERLRRQNRQDGKRGRNAATRSAQVSASIEASAVTNLSGNQHIEKKPSNDGVESRVIPLHAGHSGHSGETKSTPSVEPPDTTQVSTAATFNHSEEDTSEYIDADCPLCCEPFDDTDLAFTPCRCGYKVCLWCYHRLKDDIDGKCPGCRQRYTDVEQITVRVSTEKERRAEEQGKLGGKNGQADGNENLMEELFESTNGGLKQSELDASVVNLLSKLEPDLCRQAIEKFKSVTTWSTIRNKSGFVTAEIQKLRQQMLTPTKTAPSQTSPPRTIPVATQPGNVTLAASSGRFTVQDSDMAPAMLGGSQQTGDRGNGGTPSRTSWAAAVSPINEAVKIGALARSNAESENVDDVDIPNISKYPRREYVERLSARLAQLPAGKQSRWERKRLTQRLWEAQHSEQYIAETCAMDTQTAEDDFIIGSVDTELMQAEEFAEPVSSADDGLLERIAKTAILEHLTYVNFAGSLLSAKSKFVDLVHNESPLGPASNGAAIPGQSRNNDPTQIDGYDSNAGPRLTPVSNNIRPIVMPGTFDSIGASHVHDGPASNWLAKLGLSHYIRSVSTTARGVPL
jgi:hypothetical protein